MTSTEGRCMLVDVVVEARLRWFEGDTIFYWMLWLELGKEQVVKLNKVIWLGFKMVRRS